MMTVLRTMDYDLLYDFITTVTASQAFIFQ